ncbi:KpsF/GutQ family sugar-phosphate isomerase [Paracraurococcus lichenis]|uniref:KpsF/GutQ family sugar-phosphate isomerase n=1 Tax=Paracraurococcus lichenis TaxID=3064888 RepID=A0ABT9DWL4_9PROT|nr:KpsF/GutQ family sugar-phosphate isomerase [Paracraurococcus sp. LOR1-02]MDO9708293.1 KpsF/GutQ family sugar-phosphate isomerase [Paracraurococcus sp. LOR1-02]
MNAHIANAALRRSPADAKAIRAAGLRTLEIETAGLGVLQQAMRGPLGDAFVRAVETIHGAEGRLIVTGMGKSGHVGNKITATLASTGTPCFFLHPAEASHGDLGMVTQGDVILALSWSGETAELRDIIHYSRRHRVPLIAITSGAASALGKAADIPLILPKVEEACPHGLAPTTSTTLQLALGDAIAVALLEKRGFTPANFHQFHPGGKLGAQLLTVGDLMKKAPDLPLVRQDMDMGAVIVAMTGHSLGCAIVVDEAGALAGIITDGDLRRHMAPDIMQRKATELMTRSPTTVVPEMLASAALKEMNDRKISVLVALDGSKPVGALHMHALLQAGVA